ncbi:ArnT family glycosyltransferase [Veillonella agrestimuris]|uniref:ArnT family glycosyltransferase n=1 Tax=Veillonella agrestimuris TaxID=2941340 RepID=UPI00203B45FD|nr:glycosyltransferase family 39 protein [Veillonella agrestimuris]
MHTQHNHVTNMILLFLLTAISYGFFNAHLAITDPVESNYVLTAKTMIEHNSWISPMIYNQVWFDKPPLTYWALMICYKLFGISDFVSRIPNTLTAATSVTAMYYMVYRLYKNISVALISAVVLMSTLLFWYISHAVITDGFLFLFSLGIFAYGYIGLTQQNYRAINAAYACAGLAVITKGPIGLLLPGLIFMLFTIIQIIIHRENPTYSWKRQLSILVSPLGILLFLAIASPWYIAMYQLHGIDFINGFLGLHNVDRALISEHPKFNVWYYYLLLMPIALFPWTPLLIHKLRHTHWMEPFNVFSALWFISIVLFYSMVATKYMTYTFLAIIPCVIWISQHIYHLFITNQRKAVKRYIIIPVFLYVIIFLIGTSYDKNLTIIPLGIACIITLSMVFIAWRTINNDMLITESSLSVPRPFLYITVILCIIYSAITITVAPILTKQSGLQYVPLVESHRGHVYIYGSYYTSIVYYTNEVPTSVFVGSNDDPRWTKGKALMPTITKDEFMNRIVADPTALVIVPKKFKVDYENSIASTVTQKIGANDSAIIYERNKK